MTSSNATATAPTAAAAAAAARSGNLPSLQQLHPHAFHWNLPQHHVDQASGLPYITQFAHQKARAIIELYQSIQLTPDLFEQEESCSNGSSGDGGNGGTGGDGGGGGAASSDTDMCKSMATSLAQSEQPQQATKDSSAEQDDEEEEELYEDDEEDDDAVMRVASKAAHAGDNDYDDDDDDDDPQQNLQVPLPEAKETLSSVTRKCFRLSSQLSTWVGFKHGGISQLELCEMILHLLRLVSCTVSFPEDDDNEMEQVESGGSKKRRAAILHFESFGYICWPSDQQPQSSSGENNGQELLLSSSHQALQQDLSRRFALPAPARETLLMVLMNLMSNKGPLRSVSNAAIFPISNSNNSDDQKRPQPQQQPRFLLILHWQAFLRMLLRTAPYLDEHKMDRIPLMDASSRLSTIQKRTAQLIRDARHFFDQGLRPPPLASSTSTSSSSEGQLNDATAWQVWEMVQTDVLHHSHTHACYRGTILLYLLQPSRCTAQYYLSVMPLWLQAWTNIDRCPEYDFLWLALFCRARKHVASFHPMSNSTMSISSTMSPATAECCYDWGPIRRRLLTYAQYWLQLPIGGAALDKSSFPRAPTPRSRSCPSRLKTFAGGASSSFEEGIDFVAKIAKLLVTSLGTSSSSSSSPSTSSAMSEGTLDVLRFWSFVTPYFHPSNLGSWTFTLGAFLHYFCYELCCRVGTTAGVQALQQREQKHASSFSGVVEAMSKVQPDFAHCEIPPHELVPLLHALLPLCQQALYSKNGHVGRAGEAAMLYLVQIDPLHTTPAFLDFAIRALDISAVNLAHQAPSALSALTRLVQPALRSDSTILLARLPELLRLSLAGIDSNDQNKSIRTLILYRALASWIPIGGQPADWACIQVNESNENEDPLTTLSDGTMRIGSGLFETLSASRQSPAYTDEVHRLPENSLLKQGITTVEQQTLEMERMLLEEATSAAGDWALEFLDRVFGLLRACGEREKQGKRLQGVASRHSSADVHQARNFSRILKECLQQVFCAMSNDVHAVAVRSVANFLQEETLPWAAKDASLLCEAAAAARHNRVGGANGDSVSPGLDALVPILTDDLAHHSTKTAVYRVRCLAGAVRSASYAVERHKRDIFNALDFALASDDRDLFKTGCKLLRHTLGTLCESYPIVADMKPRAFVCQSTGRVSLGRSAHLHKDPVQWHVPTGSSIDFAWELFSSHVVKRLDDLCSPVNQNGKEPDATKRRSRLLSALDINELRRFLRVTRYSMRGGASALLDSCDAPSQLPSEVVPFETAAHRLLDSASESTRTSLIQIRGRLSSFLVALSGVVASDTLYPNALSDLPEADPYRKALPLITGDGKVCKETCDIALLLLTRRSASFRSQESMTVWKAQKQLANDFALCSLVDGMVEVLQSADRYGDNMTVLYKDGEDSGKSLPRRLLVTRVHLFHNSMIRNGSFEVPRRLRRESKELQTTRTILFDVKKTLPEMMTSLESLMVSVPPNPLDAYEGIIDGLHALCCHCNTQVRASAISVVDYAMTRFGWLLGGRLPRLLSAISLTDQEQNGKFGIPSCALLVARTSQQGKRKRLAETIKGVCSILSLPRAVKLVLASHKLRFRFAQTICGTDALISLMPTEEMQKIVHYIQSVFSPFRSRMYYIPRCTVLDRRHHSQTIQLAIDLLAEKRPKAAISKSGDEGGDGEAIEEKGAVHWRKMLLACWILVVFVENADILESDSKPDMPGIWTTCIRLMENEMGQPLQRVALGLLGKLVHICEYGGDGNLLRIKLRTDAFCNVFAQALVYDHKEDTSVGGGHDAQWSAGVEDIIRDAARYIAPRSLFPFQRTSQSSGSFKITHCQLLDRVLLGLPTEEATALAGRLLTLAKEMVAAPPSEDQRNLQVTSAELFAGVCRYYLTRTDPCSMGDVWASILLPQLDDAMAKIPFSLSGAYFDALRFALQFCPPRSFYPLTEWLVEKIQATLWQPTLLASSVETGANEGATNGSSQGPTQGTEGFTAQSKWLYILSAVLIEMDVTEHICAETGLEWYASWLTKEDCSMNGATTEAASPDGDLDKSWELVTERLLPRLTTALGHPFDSCRDHVSRCLFRICYCYRKITRIDPSRSQNTNALGEVTNSSTDPGSIVVAELSKLHTNETLSFIDKYNALSTARRFISYCLHLGEAKFEFKDFVIPLLPLSFEGLKSTVEEDIALHGEGTPEENAAKRALEAEAIKGFRYCIAESSVTSVISYGDNMDITRVIETARVASMHDTWQVRQASAHFLRCFQGAHKFLFTSEHSTETMAIVANLLADERLEVCSAAMAALTGILAAYPIEEVASMVKKHALIAGRSAMKKIKKNEGEDLSAVESDKETRRARDQQTSVFFLCAAIMAQPYETPLYVPAALAAISKHSFARNAPLSVRDTVKKCCAEYKKTHISDNWEEHRKVFTQEQIEALEDVVSTPHYYA